MAGTHLATYLNDHLSGSVVALELLEHLEHIHAGTPTARFAAELRADIAEDRRELEAMMGRVGIAQSTARKATAWLSEKLTEVKLKLDDVGAGPLRSLEILEALSLGIEGKRLLWVGLRTASGLATELAGPDYERLERRAEEQRRAVEIRRLDAAKSALAPPPYSQ